MSKADFKGQTYAISVWMQHAADDIAAGKAKAARVIYQKPDRRQTHLDRWRLQLLKKRA